MATDSTRASLELLYNISHELATTLELKMALQRLLLLSLRYVEGERGSIIVLDEQGEALDSTIVFRSHVHSHATGQLRETIDKGLAGWVIRNRKPAIIADTSRDERWLRRADDAVDHSGPKSAICVPILARERLVGVLTVVHPKPGFFTSTHLELLETISGQAGSVLLNARLFEESQRQARVMTALAESAVAINATLDLKGVLQQILDRTAQALRVETVLFAMVDESGQFLEVRAATTSKRDQPVIGMRVPMGEGIAGKVAKTGAGVVSYNVDEWKPLTVSGGEGQTLVCAPVTSQGKILGVLEAINPRSGIFETDALFILTGIGSLAGIAIHNAQLYGQVEQARHRYHELFDDSIDPIIITDCDGHILEANRQAAAILGYKPATLQEMTIGDIHQLAPEKTGPGFERVLKGYLITYESTLLVGSAILKPVQVYVRKVQMDGTDCMQWMLRDISERKDLDALREDLIAMVYHDLRSPLANVVSSLDVMETMLPSQENSPVSSVLKIAMRSTDRIQRLVSSLLDITRLEAGQEIGKQERIDLHVLVADALEAVQPQSNGKNQQIIMQLPEQLSAVWGDEDMIRRVIINLLENAIKFSPTKSQISIGASSDESSVCLWVQDTGPGIPSEMKEAIFDKFTRLRGENAPKGLGLGLAFCRLAVQANGGKIWVESKPPEGSRFLFTLPAAD